MFRHDDEQGASLVEYALLVAMIALVCIAGLRYFGGESDRSLNHSTSTITDYFDG